MLLHNVLFISASRRKKIIKISNASGRNIEQNFVKQEMKKENERFAS